jgi:hypothetical protein
LILTPPPESQYQPLLGNSGIIFPKQMQFSFGLKQNDALIDKSNEFSNHSQSDQAQS